MMSLRDILDRIPLPKNTDAVLQIFYYLNLAGAFLSGPIIASKQPANGLLLLLPIVLFVGNIWSIRERKLLWLGGRTLQADERQFLEILTLISVTAGWLTRHLSTKNYFAPTDPVMASHGVGVLDFWPLFLFIAALIILSQAWKHLDPKIVCKYPKIFLFDKSDAYLFCVFSMVAKLSKADGVTSQAEVRAVQNFMTNTMRYPEWKRQLAINIFRNAQQSEVAFQDFVEVYFQSFRKEPAVLVNLIEVLFWFSVADGHMDNVEEDLIRVAATRFGLKSARYAAIRRSFTEGDGTYQQGFYHQEETYTNGSRHESRQRTEHRRENHSSSSRHSSGNPLLRYYEILGCKPDAPWDEIKKHFRHLMKEYHPDTLGARNVSPQMIERANNFCKSLTEAYDAIEKSRGR